MRTGSVFVLAVVGSVVFWCAKVGLAGASSLPDCFSMEVVAGGLTFPVDITFAPDNRIFVAEKRGMVKIISGGQVQPTPFIDLVDEVNDARDRGLLGIALDPNFDTTPWVYLLYVVDPIFGQPDEPQMTPTLGRLVRYLADPATGGNTALLSSRQVLLGNDAQDGFIQCYSSHAVGTLRFSADRSLFVGAGEGAHFNLTDSGGEDPVCFETPLFDPIHDIGAFRAQHLGSMAGKILRIDPDTGDGLAANPFWTGNGQDVASRVWVSGLRNPFRFALRPGSKSPETLYIGDVGWNRYEEINVAYGGENFGWPCFEGPAAQSQYSLVTPAHSGCDTIETPANPGPLTGPTIWWHHFLSGLSFPPGITGKCSAGGVFYTGQGYPPEYRGRFFYLDFTRNWMMTLDVDEKDGFVKAEPFATDIDRPVDVEGHPDTGDLYFVSFMLGEVRRITYQRPTADSDGDCDVDIVDFGRFQSCSGVAADAECRVFDLDRDADVDLDDFIEFADQYTGPG